MIGKLLGAGLLLACGGGLSEGVCEKKRAALWETESFLRLFEHLKRQIERDRCSVSAALASAEEGVKQGCLGGNDLPEPCTVLAFFGACPMREPALSSLLRPAFEALGRGSLADQLRICERTVSSLESLLEAQRKKLAAEGGALRAVCFGGAALVAILLF